MAAIDAEHYVDGLPQHLGTPEAALDITVAGEETTREIGF
jgi:hypothetical protein